MTVSPDALRRTGNVPIKRIVFAQETIAARVREIFGGANGGARSAVLLNAAGAIAASGHAKNLREGIGLAREAIDSGAAGRRLDELIAFTRAEVAA